METLYNIICCSGAVFIRVISLNSQEVQDFQISPITQLGEQRWKGSAIPPGTTARGFRELLGKLGVSGISYLLMPPLYINFFPPAPIFKSLRGAVAKRYITDAPVISIQC